MKSSLFGKPEKDSKQPENQEQSGSNEKIQLKKEELDVSRKWVKTGDVEIAKEIIEEQKIVEIPVKREEIVIKRTPVNQPSDSKIGEAEVYRIPVGEEKIDIGKRILVSDEVTIEKREVQETQEVKANLKREEARIREDGSAKISINGIEQGKQ